MSPAGKAQVGSGVVSVTERAALIRAELALAALGLTALALMAIFAIDVLLYHGLVVEPQVALAALDALVIGRVALSLARQLRGHRALERRLPVAREWTVDGRRVRVLPGSGLRAFCAGLLRPAIYVSEDVLRTGEAELQAILAHEAHHCARRDPLRQLLARAVADALRPLPPFASLAERQAALADLAADAASVDALGDRAPLASALLRFEEGAGLAPERVDRLLGTGSAATIPAAVLAAALLALAGIAVVIATMLVADWHPDLALPLVLEPAAAAVVSAPACIAAWRAGIWIRPIPGR
jgi:Zn-dependent protease with chaperone function